MRWLRYWLFWCLDYWYIAKRQVLGLRRGAAGRYALPGVGSGVPVIVIPGVYERWEIMEPIMQALQEGGHSVFVVDKLGYNAGLVAASAQTVMDRIGELGAETVAIVAHSKGGLIGKYAMLFCDPDRRIATMVAISTPFSGSVYARFLPFFGLGSFSPGDATLRRLAAETAANARITSIYGEFDPHIPGGSFLEGAAANVRLRVIGHFRLLSDPRVIKAVVSRVDEWPLYPPKNPNVL